MLAKWFLSVWLALWLEGQKHFSCLLAPCCGKALEALFARSGFLLTTLRLQQQFTVPGSFLSWRFNDFSYNPNRPASFNAPCLLLSHFFPYPSQYPSAMCMIANPSGSLQDFNATEWKLLGKNMSNICGRYLISDANVMLELLVDMGISYGSEVV